MICSIKVLLEKLFWKLWRWLLGTISRFEWEEIEEIGDVRKP